MVGQENQIEDIRFFFSPLAQIQHCLCREVDEIWQYCTGGSLTTFDNDHGTVEEGARSKVLAAKHTASLQLLCTVGGDLASLRTEAKYTFFGSFGEIQTRSAHPISPGCHQLPY